MLIGELSEKSGASQDTIRHYVEKGLIVRERRAGSGFYHYPDAAVETLRRIRELRELEMPLDQIGVFLDVPVEQQVLLLEEHLGELARQVEGLHLVMVKARRELEKLRGGLSDVL